MPPTAEEIMSEIVPELKLLTATAKPPSQAHSTDAGWDLFADIPEGQQVIAVLPGESARVPTGVAVHAPEGYYYELRGRSSTWAKLGLLTVAGLIDPGYQGELYAEVYNPTKAPRAVRHEQRICQIVFHKLVPLHFQIVQHFTPSQRGAKGWGSSGE